MCQPCQGTDVHFTHHLEIPRALDYMMAKLLNKKGWIGSGLQTEHPEQFSDASWVGSIPLTIQGLLPGIPNLLSSPFAATTTSHPHQGRFQSANEHLFMWSWAICYIRFWEHFPKELIHARCFDNDSDEQTSRSRERKWKLMVFEHHFSADCTKLKLSVAILPLVLWFFKQMTKAILLARQIWLKLWTEMFCEAPSYTGPELQGSSASDK